MTMMIELQQQHAKDLYQKHASIEQALKKIRQSPKYRARMAQLLHDQQQSNPSTSKGRKQAGKTPK